MNLMDLLGFGRGPQNREQRLQVPVGSPPGTRIEREAEKELILRAKPKRSKLTEPQTVEERRAEAQAAFERAKARQAEKKEELIDRALFGRRDFRRFPIQPYERHGRLPITPDLLKQIAKIDESDRVTLKDLAEAGQALKDYLPTFFDNKISEFLAEERDEFRDVVIQREMPERLPRTYAEVRELFQENIRVLMRELKKLDEGALPIFQRHISQLARKATAEADRLEAKERADHAAGDAKIGLPFRPSNRLVVCRQIPWRLPEMLPMPGSGFPIKKTAETLGIDL